MSHIYDINSDSLKCNFCTQWFKCTLHYANIQRYSLKACLSCLKSFNYTLIHPESFRMFRVFLFDTGIEVRENGDKWVGIPEEIGREMEDSSEDIRDRVSKYFEDKIKATLAEMNSINKKVQ